MRKIVLSLFILSMLGLAGCATVPNVRLKSDFWNNKHQKVVVANSRIEKPALYHEGNQGLLDVAISSISTNGFSKYLYKYKTQSIRDLRKSFIEALKSRDISARLYPGSLNTKNLNDSSQNTKQYARKNFKPLVARFGKNKLLLISVKQLGAIRRYYGFIPLGAPRAICNLEGRLIDLKDNTILWRYVAKVQISVKGNWDQEPRYPNFQKALDQAVQEAKQELLDSFLSQ